MSIFKDQADFMSIAGQITEKKDCNCNQIALYSKLIEEESQEFTESFSGDNEAETVKEACDVIVVAAGFLISVLGANGAQLAWNAVHESNLQKLKGKIEKREDGKILKSAEYKEKAKHECMEKLKCLL